MKSLVTAKWPTKAHRFTIDCHSMRDGVQECSIASVELNKVALQFARTILITLNQNRAAGADDSLMV